MKRYLTLAAAVATYIALNTGAIAQTVVSQDFEGWGASGRTYWYEPNKYGFYEYLEGWQWGSYSFDGWVATNITIRKGGNQYYYPYPVAQTLDYACWLDDFGAAPASSNSAVRSALITNGIGAVSLYAMNYTGLEGQKNVFAIETSRDGDLWETIRTYTNTTAAWTLYDTFVYDTNKYSYARVSKLSDDDRGMYLGIDSIEVSPPPSKVQIDSVMIHPGYPSSNDAVAVSCRIVSDNPYSDATAITASLYYRLGTSGDFTGPVAMAKDGDLFMSANVGPFPAGTRLQYYIETTFSGYSPADRYKQSPSYYPEGIPFGSTSQYYDVPTEGFPYFDVRHFYSSHDGLVVSANVGTVTMDLVDDYRWEGVLDVRTVTNRLDWVVLGYGRYTNGAPSYSETVHAWGDDYQVKFTLPKSSTGQIGGSNLFADVSFNGTNQVVFRYTTDGDTYMAANCLYQDFNTWQASTETYEESLGLEFINTLSNNFNMWPFDYLDLNTQQFESTLWEESTEYLTEDNDGRWFAAWANTVSEQETATPNTAMRLHTDSYRGEVWPALSSLTDGIDTFGFKFRATYEDDAFAYYKYGTNWLNTEVSVTVLTTEVSPSEGPFLSLFARYQDEDNYYELRCYRRLYHRLRLEIYRNRDGVKTRLQYNAYDVYGNNYLDQSHSFTFGACEGDGGSTFLFVTIGSRRVQNTLYYNDQSASRISAPGTVGVHARNADMLLNNDMSCNSIAYQHFNSWNAGTYGTYTNAGWVLENARPILYNNWYWKYWYSYCWLDKATTNTEASLTSPLLDFEPASLGFEYYRLATDTNGPARCVISGSTNLVDWEEITVIDDITQSGWTAYSQDLGLSAYRAFRFANTSTNATLRMRQFVVRGGDDLYDGDYVSDWEAPNGGWTASGPTYSRPGYLGPLVHGEIRTSVTNDAVNNHPQYWTTYTNFTCSNLTYSATNVTLREWDETFVGVRHVSGAANLYVDNFSVTSWRGTDQESNGWSSAEGWVTSDTPPANNRDLAYWRSKADPARPQGLRTPFMTNGVSSLTFRYKVVNPPAEFQIQQAIYPASNQFVTLDTVAVTTTGWKERTFSFQTNAQMFARIRHTSTNEEAVLYIDDASVKDYADRDSTMWFAYNALITHTDDSREFEPYYEPEAAVRTCYLNNSPSSGTGGTTLDGDAPFVQSARSEKGIGQISFWHRNWEQDGSPSATLRIRTAPTADTDPEEWDDIGGISGITDSSYQYFSTNCYLPDDHFVRVYGSTNAGAARVCIDGILVTEPLGADLYIDNVTTVPEVPLASQSVGLSARVSSFFLNPTNIQLRAYYHIGTNHWADWTQWNTNTDYLVLDQLVSSNAVGRTFRTSSEIPQQEVDTVVQYFVQATFDGVFSDKASPKRQSGFTNPEWYEPVDLNEGKVSTTPYYFVFSCAPDTVWINELNVEDYGIVATQYVELAGWQGSDVSGWQVEVVNASGTKKGVYPMADPTIIADEHQGYGFWLLGDGTLAGIDATLTNTIPHPGGIVLRRSMNAVEDAVCFGENETQVQDLIDEGFTYAGSDYAWYYSQRRHLALDGVGARRSDFTWDVGANDSYSPNAVNPDQTLVLYTVTQTLSVASAYGSPSPAIGVYTNTRGTSYECRMGQPALYLGSQQTQYLCSGWTRTGNVPNFSTNPTNTGPFLLLTNSTINWTWNTNVYLPTAVDGNGSVDKAGWFEQYSAVTVTATAAQYNQFTSWSGDTNGCQITSNRLVAPMTEPHELITAHFESTDHTLSVTSAHGASTPVPGQHTEHHAAELVCAASNRVVVGVDTQFVCTGWAASGDVPPMPTIGPTTNLAWSCASAKTWNGQIGSGWFVGLYADGGNRTADPIATNGISTGDDTLVTNLAAQYFGPQQVIFWGEPSVQVQVDKGLRVFTVAFNNTTRTGASHYAVITNDLALFPVEGQNYDAGTATTEDWQALVSPANHDTIVSTGPFTLTTDSSVEWLWGVTNCYLTLAKTGSGTVDRASQWVRLDSNILVTANAYASYDFRFWTGDTQDCTIANDEITIPMTRPRSISASFTRDEDPYTTMGTPYTWLEQYFSGFGSDYDYEDTNDYDQDGILTWQEYATGTDPVDPASVFAILSAGTKPGSNYVMWFSTTNGGVTTPFSMRRATNMAAVWSQIATNSIPRDPSGTTTWWDVAPPTQSVPVYYRPFLIWNGQGE